MKTKIYFSVLMGLGINIAVAQTSGQLDSTFGGSGVVTTSIGTGNDIGKSIVIQNDGKIIEAGYSKENLTDDFSMVRYKPDGSLDNSFGVNGKVKTSIGNSDDQASDVLLESDGKILVTGTTTVGTKKVFVMVKYKSDGSPDSTFGTNGEIETSIGTGDDVVTSSKIQDDGKVIVAGSSTGTNEDFAIVRYKTDGTLDNTFGTAGKVVTPVGDTDDRISDIEVQSDGKIVAAGIATFTGNVTKFAIVRYNSDGSLDNTFGTNGKVITLLGTDDIAKSVVIQQNGKIVVAGTSTSNGNDDFSIIRYNSDGSLDNTFGTNGHVITSVDNENDDVSSVTLQSDDKIVVAGSSVVGSTPVFSVVRYMPDGALDNQFGTGGKVISTLQNSTANALKIQSDGKIVIVGNVQSGPKSVVMAARLLVTASGVHEYTKNNEVNVYPNPAVSTIIIDYPDFAKGDVITIYNSQGTPMIQQTVQYEKMNIDVQNLSKGLYIVAIKSLKTTAVKQFIIE